MHRAGLSLILQGA